MMGSQILRERQILPDIKNTQLFFLEDTKYFEPVFFGNNFQKLGSLSYILTVFLIRAASRFHDSSIIFTDSIYVDILRSFISVCQEFF
jgi:hypothetical protein